jgi:hypothetical protein
MGPIDKKQDMKRAVCVVHLCNEVDFTIIIFHVQDPTKEPMRLTKTKKAEWKADRVARGHGQLGSGAENKCKTTWRCQ